MVPIEVAEQCPINESRNNKIKMRITHYYSFPSPSYHSINSIVIKDLLCPCSFFFCLLSIFCIISDMCRCWPNHNIFMGKAYIYTQYWIVHYSTVSDSSWLFIVNYIALLCLRIPVGTSPDQVQYTVIIKTQCISSTIYSWTSHRILIP